MKKKIKKDISLKITSFGCLCIIMLYSLQAIIVISSGSDVTESIIVLIFPILCTIGYIFVYIQQKKREKPTPLEKPYKPE